MKLVHTVELKSGQDVTNEIFRERYVNKMKEKQMKLYNFDWFYEKLTTYKIIDILFLWKRTILQI